MKAHPAPGGDKFADVSGTSRARAPVGTALVLVAVLGPVVLAGAAPSGAAVAHAGAPPGAPAASVLQLGLPRDQTVYTSGTAYSPPSVFNPLSPGAYTGTQGLLYEPLFIYDPVTGRFLDWLATGGRWATARRYVIDVRSGVHWVSGPSARVTGNLTGADVAWDITKAAHGSWGPFHADVADVTSAQASGQVVTVNFGPSPNYPAWEDYLWHAPVLPQGWAPALGTAKARAGRPVLRASGPMVLYAVAKDGACYRDNPYWWGWKDLKLHFSFQYLCDLVSTSSGQQLSGLLHGSIDWSNALLRGVPSLLGPGSGGYGLETYYPNAPYMMAAGTAWLEMDTAKEPMSNLEFRRAVAAALTPSLVATDAYTGTVAPAGPTGLTPNLDRWVDPRVVAKYEPQHSLSVAKELLSKSLYHHQVLSLEIEQSWPDMASAARVIQQQLEKVGVRVVVTPVTSARRAADLRSGRYDMVIDESTSLSSSPWAYFDRVFALPVASAATQGLNLERFSDPGAWALVKQAASTPPWQQATLQSLYAQLETDFLTEVPEIPIWYTGAWFAASTGHWHGYPMSTSGADHYTPVMWPGWLGATTTVLALAGLKPK